MCPPSASPPEILTFCFLDGDVLAYTPPESFLGSSRRARPLVYSQMLCICFMDSRPLMKSFAFSHLTKQACSSVFCQNPSRSALNNQTVIQPLLAFLFLRKEVIQPHLPIRLPCYDFTPVTRPAFGSSFLSVRSLTSGISDSHGVTGGVYKTRERIHRDILIRDY